MLIKNQLHFSQLSQTFKAAEKFDFMNGESISAKSSPAPSVSPSAPSTNLSHIAPTTISPSGRALPAPIPARSPVLPSNSHKRPLAITAKSAPPEKVRNELRVVLLLYSL